MLLALSFPKLNKTDFDWIQDVRKKSDKLYYDVIEPHFTFVFPGHEVSDEDFKSHIKDSLQKQKPIEFDLKCAVIVKDSFMDIWHAFLVPDMGYSDMVKLHDKLYEGKLKNYLLLEIPFIPHLGIATDKDKNKIKQLVDKINSQNISINGTIETLSLYDNDSDTNIETIKL